MIFVLVSVGGISVSPAIGSPSFAAEDRFGQTGLWPNLRSIGLRTKDVQARLPPE
jgi:hypothetical protein